MDQFPSLHLAGEPQTHGYPIINLPRGALRACTVRAPGLGEPTNLTLRSAIR